MYYRRQLEEHIAKEKKQKKELGSTRKLAYTDALTGIKNKRAFTEAQEEMQNSLTAGLITELETVFERADKKMYARKKLLKDMKEKI